MSMKLWSTEWWVCHCLRSNTEYKNVCEIWDTLLCCPLCVWTPPAIPNCGLCYVCSVTENIKTQSHRTKATLSSKDFEQIVVFFFAHFLLYSNSPLYFFSSSSVFPFTHCKQIRYTNIDPTRFDNKVGCWLIIELHEYVHSRNQAELYGSLG